MKTATTSLPIHACHPRESTEIEEAMHMLSLVRINSEEGFILFDTAFKILTYNNAFKKLYLNFCSRELHEGECLLDYHRSSREESFQKNSRKAISGLRVEEEIVLPHNDLLHSTFCFSYKPAYDEHHVIIGAIISLTDMSSRKLAEEKLQKKAVDAKTAILESITDGFLTLDRNWIVTYWNKEAERILGQPKKDIVGKGLWEVYPPAVKLKFYSEAHKALSRQTLVSFEDYFPLLNIWIGVSAYPSTEGLSVYFKDITEKKLAEEKISAANQRYDMVAMATNDAIYEWDLITDTIYVNAGYETLFGHSIKEEIMPAGLWIENLHPDEKEIVIAATYAAFSKKLTSMTRELRFRCASGFYKTVFDKMIIRYDNAGQPTRLFGAMQDITDRKKNEIAICELNEQLNQKAEDLIASNRELERFAYVASHDLQEPLRMVSSFLQLLQKKYKGQLDNAAEQYVNYAVDGADRMRRLIMDLLEYSRSGSNTEVLSNTDMLEVTSQVLENFSDQIKESGAVIEVGALPVVKASKLQMTQLIQNLVSNALKYNKSSIPSLQIGCDDKGEEWQFFVKDNGIGIEERFFEKVFVIFQRLHNKSQYSGTGIGLAICKKIIDRHYGVLWIQSEPGSGSTFFFTIKK